MIDSQERVYLKDGALIVEKLRFFGGTRQNDAVDEGEELSEVSIPSSSTADPGGPNPCGGSWSATLDDNNESGRDMSLPTTGALRHGFLVSKAYRLGCSATLILASESIVDFRGNAIINAFLLSAYREAMACVECEKLHTVAFALLSAGVYF